MGSSGLLHPHLLLPVCSAEAAPSSFAVRCSSCSRKAQDEVVKSAQQIAGSSVLTTEDIYTSRCSSDASCILTDGARPPNTLSVPLLSSRRLHNIWASTTWLRNNFCRDTNRLTQCAMS